LQQVNDTPLKLAWLPGSLQAPDHSLTLVVKGCFDLVAGGKAVVCEDPDAGAIMGDLYVGDEPTASLSYANDLVIYKPKADLTLSGVAYPPPGEAGCRVSFAVGNWRKSLAVFNDRYWRGGSASTPAPFSKDTAAVPLTYENAFGGANFRANPVGKGHDNITTAQGEQRQPLPNIEHLDRFLSSASQKTLPAGFGPLKDNWADKTPITGTYGDKWLKENFPFFPPDFDWGYFNTAPKDQQVAYLQGDETLYFENLRPDLAQFNAQLPALRPRLFVKGQLAAHSFFVEVTLRLDSLHVDMEAQQVNLVWRGVVGVQSDEFEEISHACLYVEDMATDQQPQTFYLGQCEASELAEDTEHQLEPFEDEQGADLAIKQPKVALPEDAKEAAVVDDTAVVEDTAVADDTDGEIDKQLTETFDDLKKQMRDAGMPAQLIDDVGVDMDPQAFMDKIAATYNIDLSQGEALIAKGQQDLKDLFTAHGHDASVLDIAMPQVAPDADEEDAPAAAKAPQVDLDVPSGPREEDMAAGDLSGADLSNQDLSNRDFSEADLAGANLSGADISGCHFSSADLTKANLSGANAQGANFDNAIMTGVDASRADFTKVSAIETLCQQGTFVKTNFTQADLSHADFSEAVLAGALFSETVMGESLFEKADLSQCQFIQASATGANFNDSNLREIFCEKSTLNKAVFSGARLSLSQFEYSDLSEAVLETIDATGVHFFQCTLDLARAGEQSDFSGAEFEGGSASGLIFDGANLSGAKFKNMLLAEADFTEANLSLANFKQCNMKNATLSKADLRDTKLVGANLFEADFSKATLTRTDLALSNLYGAEFYQAMLQDTNLKGANIKQTKIELGMVK
jgi:uncharacterized protein YjbI with pentapeptide repeats